MLRMQGEASACKYCRRCLGTLGGSAWGTYLPKCAPVIG